MIYQDIQHNDGQYFTQYDGIIHTSKFTDLTLPDSQSEILIFKIKKEEVGTF